MKPLKLLKISFIESNCGMNTLDCLLIKILCKNSPGGEGFRVCDTKTLFVMKIVHIFTY